MKETTTPAQAPVASPGATSGLLKKLLSGSTFMTLEHVGHMVLVFIVTALVAAGIRDAWGMWLGSTSSSSMLTAMGLGSSMSIYIVSALLVLVPLLVILDRRTRAEWQKRSAFAGTVGYKLPLYTALGAVAAALVCVKIALISVILGSLANIGVDGVDIGKMYVNQFLPELFTLVAFAGSAWYVYNLAKGRDFGRTYSAVVAVVALVVVVALYITAIVNLHKDTSTSGSSSSSKTLDSYQDILNQYYNR